MFLNRKFLLADDDADDVSIFYEALTLTAPEVECYAVENGKQVFEFLSANEVLPPDVIFLDINMPKMNGWQCLKMLKNSTIYKDIPIFMYSTSSAKRDIEIAYNLGATVFLTKPEDFEELCSVLKIVATVPPESFLNRLAEFDCVKSNSPFSGK